MNLKQKLDEIESRLAGQIQEGKGGWKLDHEAIQAIDQATGDFEHAIHQVWGSFTTDPETQRDSLEVMIDQFGLIKEFVDEQLKETKRLHKQATQIAGKRK